MGPVSDESLDKALIAQTSATAPRLLRDMTGFGWDEVMVLSEGTTADEIQSLTGARIIKGDRYVSSANAVRPGYAVRPGCAGRAESAPGTTAYRNPTTEKRAQWSGRERSVSWGE